MLQYAFVCMASERLVSSMIERQRRSRIETEGVECFGAWPDDGTELSFSSCCAVVVVVLWCFVLPDCRAAAAADFMLALPGS